MIVTAGEAVVRTLKGGRRCLISFHTSRQAVVHELQLTKGNRLRTLVVCRHAHAPPHLQVGRTFDTENRRGVDVTITASLNQFTVDRKMLPLWMRPTGRRQALKVSVYTGEGRVQFGRHQQSPEAIATDIAERLAQRPRRRRASAVMASEVADVAEEIIKAPSDRYTPPLRMTIKEWCEQQTARADALEAEARLVRQSVEVVRATVAGDRCG